MAYEQLTFEELKNHSPLVVIVDAQNQELLDNV